MFTRKLNKHHKPVGKPILSGFRLEFSVAMNPASTGDAGNYQVDWISTTHVKKKVVKLLHAVPIRAEYDDLTDSVNLLLSGKEAFQQGGQITVLAAQPDGVSGASGVLLDGGNQGQSGDNGVFTILPRGSGITRG